MEHVSREVPANSAIYQQQPRLIHEVGESSSEKIQSNILAKEINVFSDLSNQESQNLVKARISLDISVELSDSPEKETPNVTSAQEIEKVIKISPKLHGNDTGSQSPSKFSNYKHTKK